MNNAGKHGIVKQNHDTTRAYPFAELLTVASIFGLFVVMAVASPVSIKDNILGMSVWIIAAAVFFGVSLVGTVLTRKGHFLSLSSAWFWALAAGLIVAATRLPFISEAPLYWDSSFYFYAIDHAVQQFDFTLSSVFQNFKMGGHPAYGYASLLAIFHFCAPFTIESINIANLAIETLTAVLLAKFLIDILPRQPKILCVLLSVSVLLTPLLFGTFGSVNLDRPMACFFIIALYLAHNKRFILTGFTLLLIVGTKEPGLSFFFIFILVLFIVTLIQAPKHKRLRTFVKDYGVRSMAVALLVLVAVLVLDIVFQGDSFIWSGFSNLVKSIGTETPSRFGIDYANIVYYAKISFLLNFGWLFWAISLCFLVFELVRRKWDRGVIGILRQNKAFCCYIIGIFAYLFFSFVYITLPNPRYLVSVQMTAILLAGLFVLTNVPNVPIKIGYSLLSIVLCVAQAFVTIDPVTIRCFSHVGEPDGSQISCSDTLINSLPDACAYNHQVMVFGDAINQIFDETDYDGSFTYVVPLPNSVLYTYYSLGGWQNDQPGMFVWDEEASRRVIATPEGNGDVINSASFDDWYATQVDGARDQKVVFITSILFDVEWQDGVTRDLELLSEKYDLVKTGKAGYGAYELDYYEYVLKS